LSIGLSIASFGNQGTALISLEAGSWELEAGSWKLETE
jgi:hypothetical protein